MNLNFQLVKPEDDSTIEHIAEWYFKEWKIPKDQSLIKLKTITSSPTQFQVLTTLDGVPISTAGLYNHIGLLDKVPRLSIYKNWLALVYTIPSMRQKGYGALICNYIHDHSKKIGLNEIYLFTDTAESLYERLGWKALERLPLGNRNIVVMKKEL
jgi:N-acetylglutamate synthase-like GNAT family acetyltransferase